MRLIDIAQGSDAWKTLRSSKIGASDLATILGLNPFKTPYMLYQEKLGLDEVKTTMAMKRGHAIEDEARDWFHKEYGIAVAPMVATHDIHDCILASFDGIDEDTQTLLEIKHVKQEYHEMACCGKVPELYWPQLQQQIYVADYQECYYLSYKPDNPAVVIVKRDHDFMEKALQAAYEFYECLVNRSPPLLTERDYVDMSDCKPLKDLAERYKYHSSMEREHKLRCDSLKEDIKKLANDRNIKGDGFKLTKYSIPGRMDYDKIICHHNIDIENCQEFMRPSTTAYRITVE